MRACAVSLPHSTKRPAKKSGATWLTGSYDAALDTLYWAVGNPGPDLNGDDRPGDNLYSDSVVALNAKTGKLKWHYQFTPHDVWDWDAQSPLTLIDATWEGKPRKLLLQANRNGFFYTLDRVTGELLLAKPFVKKLTWAKEIGPNGRPVLNPNQEPTERGNKICPALVGAANRWSTGYDPASKLYFVQTIGNCEIYFKRKAEWEAGGRYFWGTYSAASTDPPERILRAIDPKTGKSEWEIAEVGTGESRAGLLATGRPVWSLQTNLSLRASPMTYVFDNRQRVAIAAGSSILVFGLLP